MKPLDIGKLKASQAMGDYSRTRQNMVDGQGASYGDVFSKFLEKESDHVLVSNQRRNTQKSFYELFIYRNHLILNQIRPQKRKEIVIEKEPWHITVNKQKATPAQRKKVARILRQISKDIGTKRASVYQSAGASTIGS